MRVRAAPIIATLLAAAGLAVLGEEVRTVRGPEPVASLQWRQVQFSDTGAELRNVYVEFCAGEVFVGTDTIQERSAQGLAWARVMATARSELQLYGSEGLRCEVHGGPLLRTDWQFLCFVGQHGLSPTTFGGTRHRNAILLPFWFLPALLAAWPCWMAVRACYRSGVRGSQARLGLCVACGYDMTGTPTRCPECGTVAPDSPVQERAVTESQSGL